jgi:hypothetical protein
MKCQVNAMPNKLNVQFVLVKQQAVQNSKLIKNGVDQVAS